MYKPSFPVLHQSDRRGIPVQGDFRGGLIQDCRVQDLHKKQLIALSAGGVDFAE